MALRDFIFHLSKEEIECPYLAAKKSQPARPQIGGVLIDRLPVATIFVLLLHYYCLNSMKFLQNFGMYVQKPEALTTFGR